MQFQLFAFFQIYSQSTHKKRYSVKTKNTLLFSAIANLQFKHLFWYLNLYRFYYASLNFHIFSKGPPFRAELGNPELNKKVVF